MATLPGPDAVGPLPDNLPRRMGVGGWNPRVISEDTNAAGQGLERLGTGIADFDHDQNLQADQLQMAQAHAAVVAGTTAIASKLPTITDPNVLQQQKDSIDDLVSDAGDGIDNPRARQMFEATITPHVAEMGAHIDERGRQLGNETAVANFEQSANTTISNAATIDNDALSQRSLQTVNAHLQVLQDQGIINPLQRQTRAQQAAADYVDARYRYLYGQALADPNHDTTRLQQFLQANPLGPGGAGAPGQPIANTALPPEAQAFLQTLYGPESGGSYSKRYTPQGGADFQGFADHPRIAEVIPAGQPNAGKTSDAAGAPQFLSTTWDAEKAKLGLKDFSPANQDAAAWDLAQTTYRQQTGGDLLSALQSRDPTQLAGVASALKGVWPSLPGGVQPGTTTNKFTSSFLSNLSGVATAFKGLPSAPSGGGGPAAAVGDSTADGVKTAGGLTGDTLVGRPSPDVLASIKAMPRAPAPGTPLVIGTGLMNDAGPKADLTKANPAVVTDQIAAAKANGYTPIVLGVGDKYAALNPQIQKIAEANGAEFVPLGPNDGTHPTDGYKSASAAALAGYAPRVMNAQGVQTLGAMPAPGAPSIAAAGPGQPIALPSTPLNQPIPGVMLSGPTPDYPLVPPQSEWPTGTDHVVPKGDGTLAYVAKDGTMTPVPGILPTGTPSAPVPDRPTGSLLDALPPQKHAEMLLAAQRDIDTLQRMKASEQNRNDKVILSGVKSLETQMVQGQPVSDDTWKAVAAQARTSSNPEVTDAFVKADATRSALLGLKGMSPTAVAAQIDNDQAAYTNAVNSDPLSPWTLLKGSILASERQYLKQYQTEVSKDMLGRAAKEGVLPNGVTPITPGDPNIVQAIQKRVADAQTAADFFHMDPQYLNPEERKALKQISAAGGDKMTDLASAVVAGAGANAGKIFKEIGGDAPAFWSVGAIALLNGDPNAIDDIAKYTAASNDKDARRDLPRFNEAFLRNHGDGDPLKDAGTGLGMDAVGRFRDTANILMGARAMREGKDPKADPTAFSDSGADYIEKAYNQALGGVYDKDGVQYGGITTRGDHWYSSAGKQQIIVPNFMKAKDFDTVFGSMTDADLKALPSHPSTAGGAPIGADVLKTGSLIALPDKADGLFHGRYGVMLKDPNSTQTQPVVDQNGKPWILDLNDTNALGANLRQRNPGSFIDRAPSRAPGAPSPYRGTPGMIAQSVAQNGEDQQPSIDMGE